MINPINFNKINIQGRQAKSQAADKTAQTSNTMELSGYKAGRAILARNNVNVRENPEIINLNDCCRIVLTKGNCEPELLIEAKLNNDIPMKQGLLPIYNMALNDQILENNVKIGGVKTSHFALTSNSKSIHFQCDQSKLFDALKTLDNCFINGQIKSKHINNAKKIAPVALFLSRKTDEFKEDFSDIPPSMSEEQYEELINNISEDDLERYSKNFKTNSSTHINVILNKDFFEQNENEITSYLNRWSVQ